MASWLLTRLSRETSSGRFIPEMDGLRFAAIGMVVLFHLNGYLAAKWPLHHAGALPQSSWLAQAALEGFRGVELFFVISGFILALPFAAHHINGAAPVSLRKYYLRRLTRLEPPYFVTAGVLFALAVWIQGQSMKTLLPHLLASLVYLHNVIYGMPSRVIGVAWSLEIEVQFYLLVPLLTLLFAVRNRLLRRWCLSGLILTIILIQPALLQHSVRGSLTILAYLQFFLVGFLLADIFVAGWKEAPTTCAGWDAVTLIGWPLMFVVLQSDRLTHWAFPGLIFLLYVAAFRGRWTRELFSNRWITMIGGVCYSMYLIHYEVISAVGRFTRTIGANLPYGRYLSLQAVLIGTPLICVCGAYFAVLERPCMRRNWPQQLWARLRQLPAEPNCLDHGAPDRAEYALETTSR